MNEMVERVEWALAIFFSQNRMPCMSGDPRDRLSSLQRRNLSDAARAAIEAMREPTGGMCKAGFLKRNVCTEAVWKAMIDAALKET
jgi:hypothetical protein